MKIYKNNKKLIRETLIVTAANFIVALLVNLLAWKFKLVSGGLTGYALFINILSGLPTGTVLLTMNIILLLLALVIAGKGPGMRGIYGFVTLSTFLDLTRSLFNIQQVQTPSFITTLIIITILSIAMGTAISVILANNYSVGAYSTLYVVIKKFIDIPAQNVFFTVDFILAILTGVFLGFNKGLLLIANAFIAYFVVKLVLPKFQTYFSSLK